MDRARAYCRNPRSSSRLGRSRPISSSTANSDPGGNAVSGSGSGRKPRRVNTPSISNCARLFFVPSISFDRRNGPVFRGKSPPEVRFRSRRQCEHGGGSRGAQPLIQGKDLFHRFAAVLNQHLASLDYLMGGGLTLADLSVAAPLPLAKYSKVRRWYERIAALAAWQQTAPQG